MPLSNKRYIVNKRTVSHQRGFVVALALSEYSGKATVIHTRPDGR
jgi:hypothetical protein